MKQNERTLQMKERFFHLRFVEGLTVAQIAERFRVSTTTVYRSLQEIADKNGVSRSSLLERPGAGNFTSHATDFTEVKPFSMEEFNRRFGVVADALDALNAEVRSVYDALGTVD